LLDPKRTKKFLYNGIALQWSDELRYLGVYIVRSFRFKISLINPNARSIVLRTVSLVKLGVLPLKKLLYSYLILNVFLFCFMLLKPARLVSRIWVQLTLHLIGFLWNYLGRITLKLLRVSNRTLAYPYPALSWVIDR